MVNRTHEPAAEPTRRPVTVRVLLVPTDESRRCELREVALTGAALSDAVGGGLLDETLQAQVEDSRIVVYVDDERQAKALPPNRRAAALSARLGLSERDWLGTLNGDALFVGLDEQGQDCDVPMVVVGAAPQGGLLAG